MKLDGVVTGVWVRGEYEEEYWKCPKCGRVIRKSPFGDIVVEEGVRRDFTILFPFNSSNPVQSRLNRGSDSPNPGTSYKQLGRFTLKKGGEKC